MKGLISAAFQSPALPSTSLDVTVGGLSALSTTWKSTDGTASRWKYVVGDAIVHRGVCRTGQPFKPL